MYVPNQQIPLKKFPMKELPRPLKAFKALRCAAERPQDTPRRWQFGAHSEVPEQPDLRSVSDWDGIWG